MKKTSNQSLQQSSKKSFWQAPALGVVLVALLVGCNPGEVCKELARCGGEIRAIWTKKPGDDVYCAERVYAPPPDSYLIDQPTPLARMPLPDATNLDWCSDLVLNLGDKEKGVRSATYYARDLPLTEARFIYRNDPAEGDVFDIGFARRTRFNQYYSQKCLTEYGHPVDCPLVAMKLTTHNEGNPAVSKFECDQDKVKGGCNCSFQYEESSVLRGAFTVQGDVVTHFTQSPTLRYNEAGFCVQGDTMSISGLDNSYLMGRTGLRTLELVRVKCQDGQQGPGEQGIDCGGLCPTPCP
jgi:hypothetical protein